jgi:CBS domain containing-hemolysin-like protein
MLLQMNSLELSLRLVAGVVLILANGFFVTIEFALTRARQYSEEEFVGQGRGLERAWEMTQNLEIYLTSCQVGITASSIAVGIVAEPALAALFAPVFGDATVLSFSVSIVLAYLVLNLFHLTHGEQAPTYLGVERAKQVCKYCATPLYWWTRLAWPVIVFGDGAAKWTLSLFGVEMTGAWLETEADVMEGRADLYRRFGSTLEEGDLPAERQQEVMNALAVGDIPVDGIMVPREDIVALSTENTPEENFAIIEEHSHSRYPLVGEDLDDFRGVVYLPTVTNRFESLMDGEVDIEDLVASPMTLPAEEEVSDAIDRFQAENQELALIEEGGEVVGLLTSTDAFEEVMGELDDPIDGRTGRAQPGADPAGT